MLIYKAIKVSDVSDACSSNAVSLTFLKKNIGEKKTVLFVAECIKNLSSFFNVGKNMSVEQMFETAEMVVDSYYMLKLSEIKLVFDGIKKGEYGKIYDRIDGGVILAAFEDYYEKRVGYFSEQSIKLESQSNVELSPNLASLVNNVLPKFTEEKESHRIKFGNDEEILKEWDLLRDNGFEVKDTNGRFINYEGKIINYDEFWKLKTSDLK